MISQNIKQSKPKLIINQNHSSHLQSNKQKRIPLKDITNIIHYHEKQNKFGNYHAFFNSQFNSLSNSPKYKQISNQSDPHLLTFRQKNNYSKSTSVFHNNSSSSQNKNRFKFIKQHPNISQFLPKTNSQYEIKSKNLSQRNKSNKNYKNNNFYHQKKHVKCIHHNQINASFRLFNLNQQKYLYYCLQCSLKLHHQGFSLQNIQNNQNINNFKSNKHKKDKQYNIGRKNYNSQRNYLHNNQQRKYLIKSPYKNFILSQQRQKNKNYQTIKYNKNSCKQKCFSYRRVNQHQLDYLIQKQISEYLHQTNLLQKKLNFIYQQLQKNIFNNSQKTKQKLQLLELQKIEAIKSIQERYLQQKNQILVQGKIQNQKIKRQKQNIQEMQIYLFQTKKDINKNLKINENQLGIGNKFTIQEFRQIMNFYWTQLNQIKNQIKQDDQFKNPLLQKKNYHLPTTKVHIKNNNFNHSFQSINQNNQNQFTSTLENNNSPNSIISENSKLSSQSLTLSPTNNHISTPKAKPFTKNFFQSNKCSNQSQNHNPLLLQKNQKNQQKSSKKMITNDSQKVFSFRLKQQKIEKRQTLNRNQFKNEHSFRQNDNIFQNQCENIQKNSFQAQDINTHNSTNVMNQLLIGKDCVSLSGNSGNQSSKDSIVNKKYIFE